MRASTRAVALLPIPASGRKTATQTPNCCLCSQPHVSGGCPTYSSDGWSGYDCNTPLCRHVNYFGNIVGCLNDGVCGNRDNCTCITSASLLFTVFEDDPPGTTGYMGSDCSSTYTACVVVQVNAGVGITLIGGPRGFVQLPFACKAGSTTSASLCRQLGLAWPRVAKAATGVPTEATARRPTFAPARQSGRGTTAARQCAPLWLTQRRCTTSTPLTPPRCSSLS